MLLRQPLICQLLLPERIPAFRKSAYARGQVHAAGHIILQKQRGAKVMYLRGQSRKILGLYELAQDHELLTAAPAKNGAASKPSFQGSAHGRDELFPVEMTVLPDMAVVVLDREMDPHKVDAPKIEHVTEDRQFLRDPPGVEKPRQTVNPTEIRNRYGGIGVRIVICQTAHQTDDGAVFIINGSRAVERVPVDAVHKEPQRMIFVDRTVPEGAKIVVDSVLRPYMPADLLIGLSPDVFDGPEPQEIQKSFAGANKTPLPVLPVEPACVRLYKAFPKASVGQRVIGHRMILFREAVPQITDILVRPSDQGENDPRPAVNEDIL